MEIAFVAGFGPIVRDSSARRFWGTGLGIELEEIGPDYFGTDGIDGVKAFALWPLEQAAQATFDSAVWPDDLPVPQAWVEFDVESPAAVSAAEAELSEAGHQVLRGAHDEPWGQTTARLLSPEGLLVGVTFTPWMHGVE